MRVSYYNDITAITTIAAIRTAKGNKLFPPEADHSIPSITCLHRYLNSIKHYVVAP